MITLDNAWKLRNRRRVIFITNCTAALIWGLFLTTDVLCQNTGIDMTKPSSSLKIENTCNTKLITKMILHEEVSRNLRSQP
jgi:hypothetical protein